MKPDKTDKADQSGAMLTQSVTRALGILSCFSNEYPELRVIDFAKMLNLTQSNVSRLLSTMVSLGYVIKDDMTGYYRLGNEIITLGGIALNHYEIRKQALPELYETEKKLGFDTNLAIVDRKTLFYLAHVDSYGSPRMYTFIGRRNPLHATAIGKVLLAHMEPEEASELLAGEPLKAYTDRTIVDMAALTERFELIRRRGYETEIEELALGRACMAAPIFGRTGKVVAGMSISSSLSKINLKEREEELAGYLIEMTDRVSMKMGRISATYSG
ncbi:IclR family transcriptional regulator [Paenibacillus cymbidii]|uniref:IclR family transcriptional regulator n=1 Tax=Paenibacillus cymbidii TaxID=1639034 RepID=UPI001081304C|nr:IclR family transcriptional regulator [Paenibacillus cymbidii]